MKKILIVLLISMIYSISAVALSTEIQYDMLKVKLTQQLKDKEYSKVPDTINRIKSLGVSTPESFDYFEGKALFESGKKAQSYSKFERYISNTGKQGKYYKPAISYMIKAEDAHKAYKENIEKNGNSFGKITRYPGIDGKIVPYPLDRAGTLKHPNGTRCTAVYIGGNYILTAAHCVMKKNENKLQKGDYTFEHIQLRNGRPWDSRKITSFHFKELKHLRSREDAKYHWAILELDRPISDPKRSFGYKYPGDKIYDENDDSNYNLSILGHAVNFNDDTKLLTFSDRNCEIKKHIQDNYVALHDCDAGSGDSGSPLYKCSYNKDGEVINCNISAIHVGALTEGETHKPNYSDESANIAVTMKSFASSYYYLRMGGTRPSALKSVNNSRR